MPDIIALPGIKRLIKFELLVYMFITCFQIDFIKIE